MDGCASELQCGSDQRRSRTSYEDAGSFASAEEAIRGLVLGIEDSDLIERDGHPDQRNEPLVASDGDYRVVRDGSAVASVSLTSADGGYLVIDIDACRDSGIQGAPALGR
jgi:hypothetical protein